MTNFNPPPFNHEWFTWHYTYDPLSGRLRNNKTGKPVGSCRDGYMYVNIKRRSYAVSRLAVFYMLGAWPDCHVEIDHKDWDRVNNRWHNLVITDKLGNAANSPRKNKLGYKGVNKSTRKRVDKNGNVSEYTYYTATIVRGNVSRYLGCFPTAELAGAAFEEAVAKYDQAA